MLNAAIQFLINREDKIGLSMRNATKELPKSQISELSELCDDLSRKALSEGSKPPERLKIAKETKVLSPYLYNDWLWLRSLRNNIRHEKMQRSEMEWNDDLLFAQSVVARILIWYVRTLYNEEIPEPIPEPIHIKNQSQLPKDNGHSQKKSNVDNLEDVLLIAFYLAKFEHNALQIGNQTKTFNVLAEKLGVKASTLRNHRDRFDRHVEQSPRAGWDAELVGTARSVLDEWNTKQENEVFDAVHNILNNYS